MVVSGLLVNTAPEKLEQVKDQLLSIEGVEINSVLDDQKLVVVVESRNDEDEAAVSKRIEEMEGVLSVNIAYHHFGDDEEEK